MNEDRRVLWLNGPFGVGKTTAARHLAPLLGARIYDPEPLGVLLGRAVPAVSDFQHLPTWRRWTPGAIRALLALSRRPVVVPMTVYVHAYLRELLAPLASHGVVHVTLLAGADVLGARLARRGHGPGTWPNQRVDRILRALSAPVFGPHVDTDHRTPAEVAAQVAALWRQPA